MHNNYEMMTTSVPEHEKLFDEICNKLNELSTQQNDEEVVPTQPKYEQMQVQMKKFHSELQGSQEELREKIKTLEGVSYGPATLDSQTQLLADQLSSERSANAKLSADLAKSLELSLQLQLEIQGLKARAMQMQSEEKKYSQALFDKTRILQRDLDLMRALRDELSMEFEKAKKAFATEQSLSEERQQQLENEITALKEENFNLQTNVDDLNKQIIEKDHKNEELNLEIEKISTAFNEVEASAAQKNEALKNWMNVAEAKIVELKVALDKKTLEAQDYYSHLQQSLTQTGITKQENAALKEYVGKLNYYHQQAQQAQMAVAQMAQAAAQQVGQPQQGHMPQQVPTQV